MEGDNKIPELSPEQKDIILQNFDKMTLKELVQLVFNDKGLDGRSNEGRAVKQFLALDGKAPKSAEFIAAGPLELNEEQKLFVKTNFEKISKTLEMVRLLFKDDKLSSLSREFIAVHNYKKELSPDDVDSSDEVVAEKTYKPPYNIAQIIGKINDHVPNSAKKPAYEYGNLKPQEERNIRSLIGYMKTSRFVHQASSFDKKIDREVFEGEMIRFCLDKPDLEPEEVSQYISLCSYIVSEAQATRILTLLERRMEDGLKNEDEKVRNISINMAETVNAYRARVGEASNRQKLLYEKLTQSRSTKLKDRLAKNASVLNLLELWQNQEKREALLEMAEKEREADEGEVKRLSNMDEVMALIAGLTDEEAENGLQ